MKKKGFIYIDKINQKKGKKKTLKEEKKKLKGKKIQLSAQRLKENKKFEKKENKMGLNSMHLAFKHISP